jgi:hypothetical protein
LKKTTNELPPNVPSRFMSKGPRDNKKVSD